MSDEKKPPMTFRELKEFVNSLNETQLDESVAVQGEDSGEWVYGADTTTENYYYRTDEPEDSWFESDFRREIADGDIVEVEFTLVPAGQPRLWNFA